MEYHLYVKRKAIDQELILEVGEGMNLITHFHQVPTLIVHEIMSPL
jgi:hypothetical protein